MSDKLKRRQFIANLLFAGGTLAASSFLAQVEAAPVEKGWELPDDVKDRLEPKPEPPKPQPRPRHRPTPDEPHVKGKIRLPDRPLPGSVAPPRPYPAPEQK